jgi:hypothetical protein
VSLSKAVPEGGLISRFSRPSAVLFLRWFTTLLLGGCAHSLAVCSSLLWSLSGIALLSPHAPRGETRGDLAPPPSTQFLFWVSTYAWHGCLARGTLFPSKSFRFVSLRCVSFRFVSFRFVSLRPFRFVSFRFVSCRAVSFRFVLFVRLFVRSRVRSFGRECARVLMGTGGYGGKGGEALTWASWVPCGS